VGVVPRVEQAYRPVVLGCPRFGEGWEVEEAVVEDGGGVEDARAFGRVGGFDLGFVVVIRAGVAEDGSGVGGGAAWRWCVLFVTVRDWGVLAWWRWRQAGGIREGVDSCA
jgi:hypothetical protein